MNSIGINLNVGSEVDDDFKSLVSSIPHKLKKIQGIAELDPFILSKKYFDADGVSDISIDPNANMGQKSPVSFQSEIFKPQLKYNSYYELWDRLRTEFGVDVANDCTKSILDGSLYYHDIVKNNMPYCFAFDTSFLMTEGRPYGWLPSSVPKRSNSFMSQVIETTMDMSQNHAGAIGIANLLVNLAYFTRKERGELHKQVKYIELTSLEGTFEENITNAVVLYMNGLGQDPDLISDCLGCDSTGCDFTVEKALKMVNKVYDKYVQNLLQNFVHIMHNTFRIGGDSPFTNISLFDRETFSSVFDTPIYPDMSPVVENYEEVKHIQEIFVEFFHVGSPTNGKNYRFPVVTANIKTDTSGKIVDTEFFDYIIEKNRKRGAFNIHQGEKIASCCRLTSDLSALKDTIRMDTFGNGGMSIGSHRVVALNLHRMALISKYENREFTEVLQSYLEKTEKILLVHKKLLKELVDNKFLNFFNLGWEDLNMFFSTIGFTGLIDAYSVQSGQSITEIMETPEGIENYSIFGEHTLRYLDEFSSQASSRNSQLKMAFNVEEIPAENASPKMAAADNFIYGNESSYVPVELLSNQMVPLYCDVDLTTRLEVTGKLMDIVSGGSILHININEQVTANAYKELVKMMIEKYHIVHFAVNVGTTTCENGHRIPGIYKEECPLCGGKTVDWNLRVVGFNTDVSAWSPERREEFKKRQVYSTVSNILK